jgi:hypothetical protein
LKPQVTNKEIEKEINKLIDLAWNEYDKASARGDAKMTDFWKSEALDLISQLPENCVRLVQ